MIVYVLFVHKKSVSKRKVCINFIKIKNLKKPKKPIFSGVFRWWFFWVGFLLPILGLGLPHGRLLLIHRLLPLPARH
jgi:hypothetical protein